MGISDIYEYQHLIRETVHDLAGHLGGNGIDFVDEEGNSLGEEFSYSDPLLDYVGVGELISISDIKNGN